MPKRTLAELPGMSLFTVHGECLSGSLNNLYFKDDRGEIHSVVAEDGLTMRGDVSKGQVTLKLKPTLDSRVEFKNDLVIVKISLC